MNLVDNVTVGIHPFGEGFWYKVFSPHNLEFAYGAAAFLLTFSVINYAQSLQSVPKNIFVKLGEAEYIMLLIHGSILSIVNAHLAVNYSFGWLITLTTIMMILSVSYLIRRKLEAPALAYVHRVFER